MYQSSQTESDVHPLITSFIVLVSKPQVLQSLCNISLDEWWYIIHCSNTNTQTRYYCEWLSHRLRRVSLFVPSTASSIHTSSFSISLSFASALIISNANCLNSRLMYNHDNWVTELTSIWTNTSNSTVLFTLYKSSNDVSNLRLFLFGLGNRVTTWETGKILLCSRQTDKSVLPAIQMVRGVFKCFGNNLS